MRKNLIFTFVFLLIFNMTAASVHADEAQFTTIDVRTPWMGGPTGNAYQQEAVLGENVKVLINSGSSGNGVRITSHENSFDEAYYLRLVAQEPIGPNGQIPRPRWPYIGVSYGSMKVDFLTTDAVEATFVGTDRFQTPQRQGKIDIRVQANTNVDERQPPREVRSYTFKVTLRNVQGIRPDGSRVNLGNFIVLFHDQIIFMHDPAQIRKPIICGGGCGGGGVVFPPEEINANGSPVEAGTGFSRVIHTLQEYLTWLGLAEEGPIIIDPINPDDPIIINPNDSITPD